MIKYISIQRKIPAQLCFSGQAQVAQKFWIVKSIFHTVKIFRATLFFRASASCSKVLIEKIYIFSTVNSGHPLFFRASASCSKILSSKKYIQYSKNFQGKLCFSGQAQVAQKSWIVKNMFNAVKNFRGNSVFQGKRKLLKNPEYKKYIHYSENFQSNSVIFRASASCTKIVNCEKIFNTVYIHLGAIRVIWASVVCNLDQRRDWL